MLRGQNVDYQIIKIYNNNVVLALHNSEEAILVSKGIGFGKKQGELVSENRIIEKVFHQMPPYAINNLDEIHQKIEQLVEEIIQLAEIKVGKLNINTGKALAEHIEFAIERLEMGIQIDNPFIDEIMMLYEEEYAIARVVGDLIYQRFQVNIGEEEQGFIALHIHSARENKKMKETMKKTRAYKAYMQMIEEEFRINLLEHTMECKEFLRNLECLIRMARTHQEIRMELKEQVKEYMPKIYSIAYQIGEFISQDKNIEMSEDVIAFLAIDIERLIQPVIGEVNVLSST